MKGTKILTSALALALLLALAPAVAVSAAEPHFQFVTGPADGTPLEIALGYLDANKADLGLTGGDIADFAVSDQYTTKHNGVTHVYLQQRLSGVEVVNGLFNVNVMPDGRILNFGNRFVGDLAGAANARYATIEHEEAIAGAARHLGLELDPDALHIVEAFGGPSEKIRYNSAGISQYEIPVELKYLPLDDGSVRLVWSLEVGRIDTPDYWNVFVDAQTAEVVDKHNWTDYEDDRGSGASSNSAPDGYQVFAIPKESPYDGPQTIEVDPADPTASPFGWHDTDGSPGAEFTDTRGNNVAAQEDIDDNNTGGFRPDGGPTLDFLFPFDPAMQPTGGTNLEAAIVNLFYWNNVMHDLTYQYGFDEPAGNFQFNNYGNGGLGNDDVNADAQDGSGTNNANFLTTPDGNPSSRMQMFIWIDGGPLINGRLTVTAGGPANGDYEAAQGAWGGPLDPATGPTEMEVVDDGSGNPSEGCGPLIGFTPGNIALIDRGNCEFGTKALNAENAGAAGAVIINDLQQGPNGVLTMGAGVDGGSVTIPAIMIGNADGGLIRTNLPADGTMQCPVGGCPVANPINRDSDLDNGVIAHEYGHGISNRLTGGPANVGCLSHDEQAGEGWSDWWTIALTPDPSDTATTPRAVGNYVTFQDPVTGIGIRNFPYTTDMGVNPFTYEDIDGVSIPHGVGSVWNTMLWEMYWNLVHRYGFDEDLYTGVGGNNLAIQLVIDGMKLQPCSPTFVDARDAILAADAANNGNANECEIWNAFAKRGLGFSADAGGTGVGDEIEAFDLPPGIPSVCTALFSDGFESGDTSAWSSTVP